MSKLAPLLCFAIALIICLSQNFSQSSLANVWIFDSGHYIRSSQQIQIAAAGLAHKFNLALLEQACRQLKEQLLIDGPVFPGLGAAVFTAMHKTISINDTRILIELQCFLQAISAALVCLAATKLTGSRKWGLITGILWAFYPPAVIAASKFLSESLTTVLLLSLTLTASFLDQCAAARKNVLAALSALWSGLLTACIMLTKPALAPIAFGVNAFALSSLKTNKLKCLITLCMLAATTSIIAPWAAFTKLATGHISLTIERDPTYNIVLGLDRESDAWGSIPDSSFVGLFSRSEPTFATMLGIWASEREEAFNLFLRKICRLWGSPWNDYRAKFIGIPAIAILWWHQLAILFGLYGLLIFLSAQPAGNSADTRSARFIAYTSIALIFGHFTYLFAVTNGRYGFTAMPFLTLFAGYALFSAFSSARRKTVLISLGAITAFMLLSIHVEPLPWLADFNQNMPKLRAWSAQIKFALMLCSLLGLFCTIKSLKPKQRISASGTIAFLLLAFLSASVLMAQAMTSSTLIEWQCRLSPGEGASRTVLLSNPARLKPDWAMVLFDTDVAGDHAVLSVNGKELPEGTKSIYCCDPNPDDLLVFQMFPSLTRTPGEKFRQWRLAQVPLAQLDLHGSNTISIRPGGKQDLAIYGSYPPDTGKRLKIPALTRASVSKLLIAPDNLESRLVDLRTIDIADSKSWHDKNGLLTNDDLAPDWGKQFGQYRLFLVLGQKAPKQNAPNEFRSTENDAQNLPSISQPRPDFHHDQLLIF